MSIQTNPFLEDFKLDVAAPSDASVDFLESSSAHVSHMPVEDTPSDDEELPFFDAFEGYERKKSPPFMETIKESLSSPIEKISSFFYNSHVLNNMSTPSIDDVYSILNEMKPMNLGCFIADVMHAKSLSERQHIVCRVLEMYNLFWTPELKALETMFVGLLAENIHWLFSLYSDRDAYEYKDQAFERTGEFSTATMLLENFGIKIPETFSADNIKYLGLVVAGVLVITGGKLKLSEISLHNFMKRIKTTSSCVKSVKNMIIDLPTVFSSLLNDVGSLFGYVYYSESEKSLQAFHKELLDFKVELVEVTTLMKVNPSDVLLDQARTLRLNTTMQRLDNIYARMLKEKTNTSNCKPLLDDIRPLVKSLNDFIIHSNEENCSKLEPFMCVISGLPGIGKSKIVNRLAHLIVEKIKEEIPDLEHLKPSVYMRNSTDKFWSTYTGQTFIAYDDFGQVKEDEDHRDIMSIKNPNRTPCNMAIAEEKGRQFSSLGIFASANTTSVSASAVVKSIAALTRRFEVHVYVHDPNFQEFKNLHGMSPGNYEKETRRTAMTLDVHGNQIPYFCPNFSHLTFWKCPGDEPRTAANCVPVTLEELAGICTNFFMHYRRQYVDSQAGAVDYNAIEVFDRVRSEVDMIVGADEEDIIQNVANEAERALRLRNQVAEELANRRRAIPGLPVAEGEHLPALEVLREIPNIPEYFEQNVFFEQQGLHAESTSQAWIGHSQVRGVTILLQGPPGCGKSTVVKKVKTILQDRLAMVYGTDVHKVSASAPCLYIEDATVTEKAWQDTAELIMKQEDGWTPFQVLIVTINPECMPYVDKTSDEWLRIARRCVIVDFVYGQDHRNKSWNPFHAKKYYTAADVRAATVPYTRAVEISMHGGFVTDSIVREYILEECRKVNVSEFSTAIAQCVPYISREQYKPSFIIEFNINAFEGCKILYEDSKKVVTWILTNKVKLVKGSVSDGVRIGSQFSSSSSKPPFPHSISEFIITINNAQFTSIEGFITELRFRDQTLIVMPKLDQPKHIAMFKLCDKLSFDGQCFKDSDNVEHPSSIINSTVYSQYMSQSVQLATEIEDSFDVVEDLAVNTTGHIAITKNEWFTKLLKVAIFGVKVYKAFDVISSHFQSFNFLKEERTSGQKLKAKRNKVVRKELNKVCGKVSSFGYDSLREDFGKYASTAAQQKGWREIVSQYQKDPFDGDIPSNDFIQYVMTYESGEKNTPPELPKVAVIDNLFLESAEKNTPPEPPKVSIIETLFLESAEKNAPPENPKVAIIDNLFLESIKEVTPVREYTEEYIPKTTMADESLLDPALRTVVGVAARNTVDFGEVVNGQFIRDVFALMVGKKIGITVNHSINDGHFYSVRFLCQGKVKISPVEVVANYIRNDLAIFKIIDRTAPEFPRITQHFPKKSFDWKKAVNNTYAIMATPEDKIGMLMKNVKLKALEEIISGTSDFRREMTALTYAGFVTGVSTSGPILSQPGDCGSPIIANNINIQQKILGIHSAGNIEMGASAILCQEIFEKYFDFSDQSCVKRTSFNLPAYPVDWRKATTESLFNMPVMAVVEQSRHLPLETKLWTSPLALPGEQSHQPSILSHRDSRIEGSIDPYYKSISKWDQKHPPMDKEELRNIASELGEYYAQLIKRRGIPVTKLTKTQAINTGKEFSLTQLNRQSSPGWPWCDKKKKVGDFFEVHETERGAFYSIKPDDEGHKLINSVDTIIRESKTEGHYPKIPFMGALKDEPVKNSKITEVNTRSFAAAPLDYTIASRIMFGAAQGAINTCRDEAPIQIGIDAGGLEWDTMIRHLKETSNLGFDTDFKFWDGLCPPDVREVIHLVYNPIYRVNDPTWKPEDDIVRENMVYAEVYPIIVVVLDGKMYFLRSPGGVPSGSQRTAPDNSIAHTLIHCYGVRRILNRHNFGHLATVYNILMKIAKIKTYGDDGITAVHPAFIQLINFVTMEEEYSKMGMQCTPARKDGKIVPIVNVEDMEFLKRTTIQHGKYYFGALNENSMRKMLAYCKGKNHHWYREQHVENYNEEDLIATAQSCLMESSLHGKEYYNKMHQHLLQQFDKYNLPGHLPSFTETIRIRQLPIH